MTVSDNLRGALRDSMLIVMSPGGRSARAEVHQFWVTVVRVRVATAGVAARCRTVLLTVRRGVPCLDELGIVDKG